jgi:hypothetical protein
MKYQQTYDELIAHLKEQIQFLLRSAKAYDEGFTSEAKRLATVIRVLLHDTSKSTSLLTQLNKKNISFYDTALDYDPANLLSTHGLIGIQYTTGTPSDTGYIAPLDDGAPPRYLKGKVPFDDWWNKIVIVDKNKNKLTRKDLIISISNKDGGAHIDPELDKPYADLSRGDSLGWKFVINGAEIASATGPELASIRQICHELLKSLKDEFPELFK